MLATLVEEPFDDPQWLYEVKWDGYRAVAFVSDGRARLVSRNQNELTGEFPEVAQAMQDLPVENAIIDGEVVALDEEGRPSFSLMQQRTGMTNPGTRGPRNRALPIPQTRALSATQTTTLKRARRFMAWRAIRGWKGSWPSCAPALTCRSVRASG